jgi:hypothetical protein
MFGTSYHMGGRPVSDGVQALLSVSTHWFVNRQWFWNGTRTAMPVNI